MLTEQEQIEFIESLGELHALLTVRNLKRIRPHAFRFDYAHELEKEAFAILEQRVREGSRTHYRVTDMTEHLSSFRTMLSEAVQKACDKWRIKPLKKWFKFAVRSDETPQKAFYRVVDRARDIGLSKVAREEGIIFRGTWQETTLFSLVEYLDKYRQTIETLTESTGHERFENLLETLFNRPLSYWKEGYPYDVLCYDANTIRDKIPTYGFAVRNLYVSSYRIETEADLEKYDLNKDVKLFKM